MNCLSLKQDPSKTIPISTLDRIRFQSLIIIFKVEKKLLGNTTKKRLISIKVYLIIIVTWVSLTKLRPVCRHTTNFRLLTLKQI